MKRKKTLHHSSSSSSNSLKTALVYALIVFLLISASLGLKAFFLIKASKYDGQHRFTLVLYEPHRSDIVSFDPTTRTISRLQTNATKNMPIGKNISVMTDASVILDKDFTRDAHVSSEIGYATIHPGPRRGVNIYDLLRLYLLAQSIPDQDVTTNTLSVPFTSDPQTDTLLQSLFSDGTISSENRSIAIVNGTGVSGMANRLEQVLTNSGATVVSVTTARNDVDHSSIIYSKDSYTLRKLRTMFGFPTIQSNGSRISDILIQIGKDSINTDKF